MHIIIKTGRMVFAIKLNRAFLVAAIWACQAGLLSSLPGAVDSFSATPHEPGATLSNHIS